MAPRTPARDDGRSQGRNSENVRYLVRIVAAIANIGEKFGVAFAIFVMLLLAVYFLGTAQTRDDFIRELLFGSITHTRYLALFFGALIVIAIFGLDTRFRASKTESVEMKRLADERTAWQQRALNAPLSHTEEADR